jgi:aminoacyl tRNA synthase complex-interacting multifunctional protein 1
MMNSTINRQCTEKPEQYYSHPSVTRYFDHIQTRRQVRSAAALTIPPFALVSFDIESAPKPRRTVEPPKKKEKAPKVANEAATTPKTKVTALEAAPAASDAVGKKSEKKDRKEPKEKKNNGPVVESGGKKASGKSGGTANEPTAPVPSMIDLRVGHIIDGTDEIY